MRKTRIFFRKQIFLLTILAWLVLMNWGITLKIEELLNDVTEKTALLETEKSSDERSVSKVEEEPVEAAQAVSPNIRVLLTDTGFQSYYHPSVTVNSNGRTMTYTTESEDFQTGDIVIEAPESGIKIPSIQRQEGAPVYYGTLCIKKTEEGLLLINTLSLEEYLEAVVPSEMPSSYEAEALKAQAVCARTYAWKQILEGKMEAYGADVDDSVNYQVYGNIQPKETTSKAVKETEGQVLCQDGELIEAYYFSTSAGVTSTDEIWGADEPAGYLQSVPCSFDNAEPWSKWEVEIPWEMLSVRASEISNSNAAFLGLEVTKKSESNAVTEMEVMLENESFTLTGEYEIREFLSPKGCTITERNGEKTAGGTLLPSAYFSIKQTVGEAVKISGGGYGHGVGMSQTAANQMAKEGYSYHEILEYFFKDIEICRPGEA